MFFLFSFSLGYLPILSRFIWIYAYIIYVIETRLFVFFIFVCVCVIYIYFACKFIYVHICTIFTLISKFKEISFHYFIFLVHVDLKYVLYLFCFVLFLKEFWNLNKSIRVKIPNLDLYLAYIPKIKMMPSFYLFQKLFIATYIINKQIHLNNFNLYFIIFYSNNNYLIKL